MEDRGARHADVLASVDASGTDDVDRRLARLHGPDLDRRRVRAEEARAGTRRILEVIGVHQRPRRMSGWRVQRDEVVPVRLGLRTFGDLISDRDERVLDAPLDDDEGIRRTTQRTPPRHRQVEAVALERTLLLGAFELALLRGDELLEVAPEPVPLGTDDALVDVGEI